MKRVLAIFAACALAAACTSKSSTESAESSSAGTPSSSSTKADIATDPAKVPYSERLVLAKAVAARFPGPTDDEPTLGTFGLWAGILVQTDWQREAHRDRLENWSVENFSLSVAPSIFADDYRQGGDPDVECATSAYVRADPSPSHDDLPDRASACRSWLKYFAAIDERQPQATLQHLMWDAHTDSLIGALDEHRQTLVGTAGTKEEENFWGSWLEIVLILADLNFPTGAVTTVPARQAVMPNCSPVGSAGCALTTADLGPKLSFVAALANHPATIDQILSMYRQLKASPAGLPSAAASDPALFEALTAYMTAAGVPAPGATLPLPIPN